MVLGLAGLLPGISVPAGIAMLIPGIQMAIGFKAPLLSGFIRQRTVSRRTLRYVGKKIVS